LQKLRDDFNKKQEDSKKQTNSPKIKLKKNTQDDFKNTYQISSDGSFNCDCSLYENIDNNGPKELKNTDDELTSIKKESGSKGTKNEEISKSQMEKEVKSKPSNKVKSFLFNLFFEEVGEQQEK